MATRPVPIYPRELERPAILRDGARVSLRPIRPDDADRLVAFYATLSRETAYQRFFTVMKRFPSDWARVLASVDYQRRLALVAEVETPAGMDLIGVARYEPSARPRTVEVAFVVRDDWQGRGLGGILLDEITAAAEARGFDRLCAFVLVDNRRMLHLFLGRTDVLLRKTDSGVVELTVARRSSRRRSIPA